MYIQKFQKAAGSKISVTTSAAYIFDLINTAQSTTLANAGFTSKTNAIILRPEDGDIRILFNDLAPTSTNGFLVKSGEVLTLANVPLKSMQLISTSGTVVCSIQVGITSEDESSSLTTAGGSSVAVTSLIPGTGAANLGKAEDAAHTSGDTGVMALAVRNDAGTALAGTTGDYIPLTTDNLGSLRVNAGAMTDDAAFTVATSKVVPMGALADETATDSVDEGDIGAPRMTLDRRLQVKAGTALEGPGNPVIDSYATVAINLTTGANQVLVSSAADKQIWVYGYAFTVGDAAGQTVSLQDEDDTALTGIMEFAQYGGISVPPSGNFAMPVFKLATDKDLEIDITGGDVDGWLAYAIVSV